MPADQNIIKRRLDLRLQYFACERPKPPFCTVAGNRIADLFAGCKADSRLGGISTNRLCGDLQDKATSRVFAAAAGQPLKVSTGSEMIEF